MLIIVGLLLFNSFHLKASDHEELNKISEDLISIKKLLDDGVLSQDSYDNANQKLLNKRQKILDKNKPKKTSKKRSTQLEKELEVIEKLFNDGLLTEDEYLKTKEVLIDKDSKRSIEKTIPSIPYEVNIFPRKKADKKNWEKAEIIFDNKYKIYTYRPGGIKVIRISDKKRLAQITDNFKVKYFNNGENVISVKINQKKRDSGFDTLRKLSEGEIELLGKNKKIKHNPDENKLELFIDGYKILHWEGRYNKKFHAMFYQVLTRDFTSFHFYISLQGKAAIALNMRYFNKKIDKAVRAAKERIADEYDISMEQIDKILERKIGEEIDSKIEETVEDAVAASVAEAIERSVGLVMAENLADAIEQATGEAIEQALQDELGAIIDAEIAAAVAAGIEEAAVTAGWEAYFDVLAQGGSLQDASDAAYDACGSACDNY